MVALRNPFAVRNGSIILIEDLTSNERGLKCNCNCPACDGEFIARMGDIKVHHFAHSKDACDEVIAYTSGLYRMIHQILAAGSPFYIPTLAVTFDISDSGLMNEGNIGTYVQLLREHRQNRNKMIVSKGRYIEFDSAELCIDNKNLIQAIELTYKESKMAIKVMPPDTVCKIGTVSPHKDMATLIMDFADDGDTIQTFTSAAFQEYLLTDKADKFWVYNPKIERVYPKILEAAKKEHEIYLKKQQQLAEQKRLAAEMLELQRKEYARQQEVRLAEQEKRRQEQAVAKRLKEMERTGELLRLGYEQVKHKFVQQDTQIRDEFGNRWIECRECAEIKRESEFSFYGGQNSINLGLCTICMRKRN